MIIGKYAINRKDIPMIMGDIDNQLAFNMWANTKRWGMPSGKGWAYEPAWVLDILNTLEDLDLSEKNKFQNKKRKGK